MKKWLLLSIFIHTIFLSFFYVKSELPQNEKLKTEQQVEFINNNPKVIEIDNNSTKLNNKVINYYWGLGFTANFDEVEYLGTKVNAYTIIYFDSGYCGENSGLILGDKVYLVNGELISETNDIKGDEPKKLLLTLERNGRTIVIQTDRCKIWY